MNKTRSIAQEVSILMPMIGRRLLLEFFQAIEVPQTQIFTIMALYEKPQSRLSQLSRKLNVSAPTVTGIVDRLEKGGYAKRSHDLIDRRAVNVHLTKKGLDIAKKLRATLETKWYQILFKIPEADQQNFLNILKKIQGQL